MNQTELERLEQYEKDLIRLETEAENALLKLEQCIGEIRRSDRVILKSDCDRILQRLSVLMETMQLIQKLKDDLREIIELLSPVNAEAESDQPESIAFSRRGWNVQPAARSEMDKQLMESLEELLDDSSAVFPELPSVHGDTAKIPVEDIMAVNGGNTKEEPEKTVKESAKENVNTTAEPPHFPKYCIRCGSKLTPGMKFCICCGTLINAQKPKTPQPEMKPETAPNGQAAPQKEKSRSERVCPCCGNLLEGNIPFCTFCGHALVTEDMPHAAKSSSSGYSASGSRPGYGMPQPVPVPQPNYSEAQPSYSAPQPGYGMSQPSYGAPQPGYGMSQPGYGAPQPSYGMPSAPSPQYGMPPHAVGKKRTGLFSALADVFSREPKEKPAKKKSGGGKPFSIDSAISDASYAPAPSTSASAVPPAPPVPPSTSASVVPPAPPVPPSTSSTSTAPTTSSVPYAVSGSAAQTTTELPNLAPMQPELNISKVHFTAVAPKVMTKNEYSLIHLMLYENEFREAVDQVLAEIENAQEKNAGVLKIREESEVRVHLTSPDVEIEDGEETRIWYGEYLDFAFSVMVPEDYEKKQILFKASVYVNDLIASKLSFIVQCRAEDEQKIEVEKEDILKAFVSYASQDRRHVAAIIQGMKKARPEMQVFFDVESLRSGEKWENALHNEIDGSDVFFLCWSHFARASEWVEKEWKYALQQKGADWIEPVPIEPPDVCPPPQELQDKHFNDRMLFVIRA